MAEIPILETLTIILREWRMFTKPRQRDLLRVTRSQYDEMRQTHKEFDRLISELLDLIYRVSNQGKVNKQAVEALQTIAERRREGRPDRLERYEQARIYADGDFGNRVSIFKSIPSDVKEAVQSFMQSVVDYFSNGLKYEHDLGHAFRRVADLFYRSRNIHEAGLRHWEDEVDQCAQAVQSHRIANEYAWMRLSRDYYRTYSTFADHGIFLGQDDGSSSKALRE
jgi:hypothetical protein